MSGYVPNPPRGYRNSGVEPVDIHAQHWAEYKDLPTKEKAESNSLGCVFAKSCDLPDGVIDHKTPAGFIPVEKLGNYGEFAILGGRETDANGNILLKKISGNALPAALGTLLLGGGGAAAAGASCGGLCTAGAAVVGGSATTGTGAAGAGAGAGAGIITTGVVLGSLLGAVGLMVPGNLGDSSLYSEERLKALKEGRTRVRIHVEQQADGTLKGYGYNTQSRTDWEMIPVVQFVEQGSQQVADFGDGVTLIWTPAVDPSSTSGIPPLEGAPQAPQIWIYPPSEKADSIIVNPIYPPEYKDFILVFPADSGIQPLYIVISARYSPGVVTGRGEDVSGIWLAGATTGLVAPIPTRIADALRGQTFGSFDTFRGAFWRAVSNDPELFSQLSEDDQARVLTGNAPTVRFRDSVGKRVTYEIHHVELIRDGGAVYDVDNLRVNTPRNHIDLHRRR
ncbi:S-type pyocin domain-containing protein [Pseudomonas sp. UV AK001]|uniref:S-type pyocin domain-containing protein n=1 Tax=Pseudomonas sp. UV AK001 TaxID=3384791 RepID=UPI0038D4235B